MFQCPLGLMTHFYSAGVHMFLRSNIVCQCPLGLMTHFYSDEFTLLYAIYGQCQCPLGLMTHFYDRVVKGLDEELKVSMPSRADDSFLQKCIRWESSMDFTVSMPSRADDSFLRYPFKNLGFMRFPEPIFAGVCQNILTGPLFRACLQFGHI